MIKINSALGRGLALLAVGGSLLAAPAAAQTRRTVVNLQVWPELQGELALKNGDYLLLALRGQRDLGVASTANDGRRLGFDVRRLTICYEHFWSEHWSGGATARVEAPGFSRLVLVPEVLIRHRSSVGPLTFGQRLSLERTYSNNAGYVGGTAPASQTFARLRFDLEKSFPLGAGGVALRPRLSYEAATHLRGQQLMGDPDERGIQFTSLRGEVGVRVGDHFDLTPWFAYATSYYFTLDQFNSMGVLTSGGRLNQVMPVVGLDARFTLFAGKKVFERRQLPTQH